MKKDDQSKWVRATVNKTRGLNFNHNHLLKQVFKGVATTIVTLLPEHPLHADYQRMLDGGTKPNLAKLTLARKVASIVLAMWKHQEVYDPKPENAGQAEIIVSKHRAGPTGVVQLAFLPQYTRFANMARGFD